MKKLGLLLVSAVVCFLSLDAVAALPGTSTVSSALPTVTVVPHHASKTWDRVVAIVHLPGQSSDVIMQSALDDQAAAEAAAQHVSVKSLTPENYSEVLATMIDQTLLAQKAKTLSWDPQQIEALTWGFILDKATQAGLLAKGASPDATARTAILNKMAAQTGLSSEDILDQVRTQIEIRQMVQQYLAQMIPSPSAALIADYQKRHPVPPVVTYNYLTKLFPFGSANSPAAKAGTEQLALAYLKTGKFENAVSQSQSAANLPAELQTVLPHLQAGQIYSAPILTSHGYELVKLVSVEKQPGTPLSTAQVTQLLQQQQVPDLIKQLVDELRKQAKITITLS